MGPRALFEQVKRQPLLVIGGLVALFAIANLRDLFGGGQAAPAPTADVPPADPAATPASADTTGGDLSGFTVPTISYGQPSYDPFSTDPGTNQPAASYSPEGCLLPKPPVPSAYAGKGDYTCDTTTKQWIWTWNAAKYSTGGCLLPKPPVPAQYTGRGDWSCDGATKQWVWKWKDTTPPPAEHAPGKLVLPADKHQSFKVTTTSGVYHASNQHAWQHGVLTITTGPKVSVKLGNGQTVPLVRMRSGPEQGRWIRPSAGSWTAPT